VFVDPVCFLLCHSDVAWNFLYRTPSNLAEGFLALLAATELYTAHALYR
jgi:hypothetical protein